MRATRASTSCPGRRSGRRPNISFTALSLAAILAAPPADGSECRILCAPSLKLEPTVSVSNLFGGPRVQRLSDGAVRREPSEAAFELILATDVPTAWKRLGLVAETIWQPFESDAQLELELELNLKWLLAEQTGGWVSSHFDIVDKWSPAERPGDRSAYTHKLNLELDTAVAPFRWLPEGHWLRSVELEASLDYVATGLPRAGDELAPGEVLLDPASPWSFSLVLVLPIAPF